MSIQGEANEFLNLLFGDLNDRRFAQVIKVKLISSYIGKCLGDISCLGIFEIRSIEDWFNRS